MGLIKLVKPRHFYWRTCTNPTMWGVMYLCVRGIDLRLSTIFDFWFLDLFRLWYIWFLISGLVPAVVYLVFDFWTCSGCSIFDFWFLDLFRLWYILFLISGLVPAVVYLIFDFWTCSGCSIFDFLFLDLFRLWYILFLISGFVLAVVYLVFHFITSNSPIAEISKR